VSSPSKEKFLANLYRMKRDCISFMEEARRPFARLYEAKSVALTLS
jgi:hypothetical protein